MDAPETTYSTGGNIKSWAEDDRPREKLLLKGRSTLSNAELIAILIGSGTKELTAVELSRKILSACDNNLGHLARLSIKDLMQYKGIGEAKAISIAAALELGRRRKGEEGALRKKITASSDVYEYISDVMSDLGHEEFWMLLLNRANLVLGKKQISLGGMSGTVVDLRILFKQAIEQGASSIIVCHNHPSGNTQPSTNDKTITKKLCEAGKILDIPVLDHIIFTDNGYFSFADEGLI